MRDLLESGLRMIEYLRPGIRRGGLGVYSGAVRTVVLGRTTGSTGVGCSPSKNLWNTKNQGGKS